jgi:hypothetical protein
MNNQIIKSLLQDAFDLHVHVAPDMRERKLDAVELVQNASKLDLKGVVLKSHIFSTTEIAFLLNRLYPNFKSYGSITLNFPVGGLNPQAVEGALKMGARIVFMPTYGSKYFIQRFGKNRPGMSYPYPSGHDGISILRDGDLVPEMKEIILLIKKTDRALATGHISSIETKVLVRKAKEMGLNKILVNHASSFITNLSTADQKEVVQHGAMIEHCYVAAFDKENPVSITEIARQIREIGPEHCIISTDLGQPGNPEPTEGLKEYISSLLRLGLKTEEIVLMVKHNPLKIIGSD